MAEEPDSYSLEAEANMEVCLENLIENLKSVGSADAYKNALFGIKLMVEKKLFEEESKETSEECGSYEYSSERVDEEDCSTEDQEEKVDERSKVELNSESRRVLNKLINASAHREAVSKKIADLREGLASVQKAIILAESSVESRASADRIAVLYKKLVNEIANLKSNSIFKKDTDLLKEFYILTEISYQVIQANTHKPCLVERI